MVRALAEKYAFIQQEVEALGLQIHPTSRLAQEANAFLDETGQLVPELAPTDQRFRDGLEALRDFTLFEFILDDWPFSRRDTGASQRLRMALKDAVDPYAPGKQTTGRDTQLELFVAVTLFRAGLAVELGTPDVRVRLANRYFFVEAKRPKTRQGLKGALRKAAEQITKSGCPGAAFIDSTLAFNPTGKPILKLMPDAQFRRLHGQALDRGISTVEREVLTAIDNTRVLAVSFQDHQLRQVVGGWRLESCCSTLVRPGMPKLMTTLASEYQRMLDLGWPK